MLISTKIAKKLERRKAACNTLKNIGIGFAIIVITYLAILTIYNFTKFTKGI